MSTSVTIGCSRGPDSGGNTESVRVVMERPGAHLCTDAGRSGSPGTWGWWSDTEWQSDAWGSPSRETTPPAPPVRTLCKQDTGVRPRVCTTQKTKCPQRHRDAKEGPAPESKAKHQRRNGPPGGRAAWDIDPQPQGKCTEKLFTET